jgi:hypothetical protein
VARASSPVMRQKNSTRMSVPPKPGSANHRSCGLRIFDVDRHGGTNPPLQKNRGPQLRRTVLPAPPSRRHSELAEESLHHPAASPPSPVILSLPKNPRIAAGDGGRASPPFSGHRDSNSNTCCGGLWSDGSVRNWMIERFSFG